MPKSLDSPLACLLITGVVFLVFIFGRLYQSRFDPSSFIVAGDRYCDASRVPKNLTVLKDSAGFDGQFYYRLALNPFTSQPTEFGITIDAPPLRHQRILYPLLSWGLSFGNHDLLPAVMILVNFFAVCLMGWIGGMYAQIFKQHALWGILLPLYPGFLLALSRDTVEILEATLVLASLFLLHRGKPIVATVVLALAVLTKETAVLIAVAGLPAYVVEVWKRPKTQRKVGLPWYYMAVPLAVFALWQLTLSYIWGEFPIRASGSANLGMPFIGPARALLDALFQRPLQLRKSVELIFLLGFALAVLFHLRHTKATPHEVFSWMLVAALIVSLGSSVWIEDWTFLRVSSLLYVLGTVIIVAGKRRIKYLVFGCSLLLWCLLFLKLMQSYTLG